MDSFFTHGRLHVGWRMRDWTKVWYEPVRGADKTADVFDADGGAELALYKRTRGDPQYREPMLGEVLWLPPYDPKYFEDTSMRGKKVLQKRFLADAYKFMIEKDPEVVKDMETTMRQPGYTKWEEWFKQARKIKRTKMKGRQSRRARRAGTAAAAGVPIDEAEINSDTSESEEDSAEEDSAYESEQEETVHPRKKKGNMPPPPRPPPRKRSGSRRTNRHSSSSEANKREHNGGASKSQNRTPKRQRSPPSDLESQSHAGEYFGDDQDDVDSIAGGEIHRDQSPLFMSGARDSWHGSVGRSQLSSRQESIVSQRRGQSEGILDHHAFSTRHPSPVVEGDQLHTVKGQDVLLTPPATGRHRSVSRTPASNSNLRTFDLWGDGNGATGNGTGGFGSMRNGRAKGSRAWNLTTGAADQKRGQVRADGADDRLMEYNGGVDEEEAIERATRASLPPGEQNLQEEEYESGIRESIEGEGGEARGEE